MATKIAAGTIIAIQTIVSGIDADSAPVPQPAPIP